MTKSIGCAASLFGTAANKVWLLDISRPCGQCGFPNQLVSDSTLFFGESSGGSRFDVGRGVGVL